MLKYLKQLKRNFLIRVMTALGFGGMAAFCVSCEQPKEVRPVVAEQVPQGASDSEDAVGVNPEPAETAAEPASVNEPDTRMPVKKYGIVSPLPPDVVDHFDEIQVPPTPEANEAAHREREEAERQNLKPEYTEEDIQAMPEDEEKPATIRPVYPPKEYGIRRPVPNVPKYGILPPKKYGPPEKY